MFRLKNIEVDVPGKKISFSYVGNDSKRESRIKYDANRRAQKFSVKWKKGREIMVENENWALLFEFTKVAEIEFKTC